MPDDPTELGAESTEGGVLRRIAEAAARRSGAQVVEDNRLELLEAEAIERRTLRKELDLLAWQSLDYLGGSEQDMQAVQRRKLVQQARVAWQQDPQLGAAVDLMNDFVLGRGVPAPQARDPKVQEIIDEAWNDEDNQLILTSYPAQMALGTDLSLQSNLFMLMFTGADGKVKLGMLDHDTVENVVRDEDNRRKVIYYVSRRRHIKWDYVNDVPAYDSDLDRKRGERILYYQHWRNEPNRGQKAPTAKMGKGRVYHVAINRTGEMAFGHPTMHRVLRWANAFNSLMEARVDAAKAAAAFVMKRKVKGTPNQVRKLATQILSKRGELGRSVDTAGEDYLIGPRSGSVITENEQVEHESFKLDSGSAGANVDGQMIRSQISAATHFPQHYLGDIGSANLATATSMELPVLKAVESRQEVFEQLFRWFIDRVIEEAVKAGAITETLSDEEWAKKQEEMEQEGTTDSPPVATGMESVGGQAMATQEAAMELGAPEPEPATDEERKRDLSYDFSLPNPLRRMMSDLVNSVSTIARTFDPNGTNMELSRTLLGVALGEGLEMEDPGQVVEKVFPPGYQDPAMAALQAQQEAAAMPAPAPEQGPMQQVTGPEPGLVPPQPGMAPTGEADAASFGSPPPEQAMEAATKGDLPETAAAKRLSPEARKRLALRRKQLGLDYDEAAEVLKEDS